MDIFGFWDFGELSGLRSILLLMYYNCTLYISVISLKMNQLSFESPTLHDLDRPSLPSVPSDLMMIKSSRLSRLRHVQSMTVKLTQKKPRRFNLLLVSPHRREQCMEQLARQCLVIRCGT